MICVDVDECANDNMETCSKDPPVKCINTIGSFECASCPPGLFANKVRVLSFLSEVRMRMRQKICAIIDIIKKSLILLYETGFIGFKLAWTKLGSASESGWINTRCMKEKFRLLRC